MEVPSARPALASILGGLVADGALSVRRELRRHRVDRGSIQMARRPSIDLADHSGVVRSATFSPDERLLATSSGDNTVRLWRTDTWQPVAQFDEPTANYWPQGIAFHPTHPFSRPSASTIASSASGGSRSTRCSVRLREKTSPRTGMPRRCFSATPASEAALRLVLTGEPFATTVSTYGRRVWTFSIDQHEGGQRETRETLLWDMAGQPGYRLIHQLHLNEVAVAMLVFDARQAAGDPLASVRHWERAFARRSSDREHRPCRSSASLWSGVPTFRPGAPARRIEAIVRDWELDGFFETSAQEGRGIAELALAIRAAIDRNVLPKVKSPSTSGASRTSFWRKRAAAV